MLDRQVLRLLLVAGRLAEPRGDHTEAEVDCLCRWAAGRRCLVELGVNEGRSTARLRSVVAESGSLYAVDPFPPGRLGFSAARAIARLAARRAPGARIHWLRTTAENAAMELAARGVDVDFVFSDACFSYDELQATWLAWRQLLVPGGIWVQSTSRPAVGRADECHDTVRWTNQILATAADFELVDAIDTFTVARKR